MHDVYSKASMILCWLGPCTSTPPDGHEAEECVNHNLGYGPSGKRAFLNKGGEYAMLIQISEYDGNW